MTGKINSLAAVEHAEVLAFAGIAVVNEGLETQCHETPAGCAAIMS